MKKKPTSHPNNIFNIPYNAKKRVETGAIQFGENDYPGIFIRGDNCAYYSQIITLFINSIEHTDEKENYPNELLKQSLLSLVELLNSAIITNK